MKANFEIELLPEAVSFLENVDEKAREKIYYNIKKAQFIDDKELFKKLNNLIWEFRTFYDRKSYRLFSFWDKSGDKKTLAVATHGILKNTQKAPIKEIRKAEKIMQLYIENKIKK
jgi:phage-related protein